MLVGKFLSELSLQIVRSLFSPFIHESLENSYFKYISTLFHFTRFYDQAFIPFWTPAQSLPNLSGKIGPSFYVSRDQHTNKYGKSYADNKNYSHMLLKYFAFTFNQNLGEIRVNGFRYLQFHEGAIIS